MIETAVVPVLSLEPALPLTTAFAADAAKNILGDIPTESLHIGIRQNILGLVQHYVTSTNVDMLHMPVAFHEDEPILLEVLPTLRSAFDIPAPVRNIQKHGNFIHKVYHDAPGETNCLILQDTHHPEQTLTVVFTKTPTGPVILKEALVSTEPLDAQHSSDIAQLALSAMEFAQQESDIADEEAEKAALASTAPAMPTSEDAFEPQPAPPTPVLLPSRRGRKVTEDQEERRDDPEAAEGEELEDQFAALEDFVYQAASELAMSPEDAAAASDGILALAQALISPNPRRRKKLALLDDEYIPLYQIGDAANMQELLLRSTKRLPENSKILLRDLLASKKLRMNLFLGKDYSHPKRQAYCLIIQTPDSGFAMMYQRGKDGITVLRNVVCTNKQDARKLSPYDYAHYTFYKKFQAFISSLKEIGANFTYQEV